MRAQEIVTALSNGLNVKAKLAEAKNWALESKAALILALFRQAIAEVQDIRDASSEQVKHLKKQVDEAAQKRVTLLSLLVFLKGELKKKHFLPVSQDAYGKEAMRASKRLMRAAEALLPSPQV